MNELEILSKEELPQVFRDIKESDLTEAEKLAKAFDWLTARVLTFSKQEIELARAMKDQEALVREQIKHEMLKSSRTMFQDCFRAVLGRKAWDE